MDKKERKKRWDTRRRKKAIRILGDKCARCGFSDWRALQIDHVNGGGTQQGTHSALDDVIHDRNLSSYQCLCANCNAIKKIENNEHRWNKSLGQIERSLNAVSSNVH